MKVTLHNGDTCTIQCTPPFDELPAEVKMAMDLTAYTMNNPMRMSQGVVDTACDHYGTPRVDWDSLKVPSGYKMTIKDYERSES